VSASSTPAPTSEPGPTVDRSTVDFGVGLRGFTRSFGTTDGSGAVPQWSGGSPGVAVSGSWFPGAFATKSLWGDLGLTVDGTFAIGLATQWGTQTFATSATLLRGGLALRVPGGRHQLLLNVGVESSQFSLAPQSTTSQGRPSLPDVAWFGPRGSIGWAVALGQTVSFTLKAGVMVATSSGPLGVTFPQLFALGVDGSLGLSWTVVPNLAVRVHGDFSRFFISLDQRHPAAETSFGGGLSVAFHL
jgi:hypothetical protein